MRTFTVGICLGALLCVVAVAEEATSDQCRTGIAERRLVLRAPNRTELALAVPDRATERDLAIPGWADKLAISPDGSLVALVYHRDLRLQVVNRATGQTVLLAPLERDAVLTSWLRPDEAHHPRIRVAFVNGGRWVMVVLGPLFVVIDVASRRIVADRAVMSGILGNALAFVRNFSVTPDGRHVLLTFSGSGSPRHILWSSERPMELPEISMPTTFRTMFQRLEEAQFVGNGAILAYRPADWLGGRHRIARALPWTVEGTDEVWRVDDAYRNDELVTVSPDGRWSFGVIRNGGVPRHWVAPFPGGTPVVLNGDIAQFSPVRSVHFPLEGPNFVTFHDSGAIKVWNLTTGTLVDTERFADETAWRELMAVSADGRWLVLQTEAGALERIRLRE